MKILVFPTDIDLCYEFVDRVNSLSVPVIGASSVTPLKVLPGLSSVHQLPYVTDESFNQELLRLVSMEKVTHIYSPHGGIWAHLMRMSVDQEIDCCFQVCQPSPTLEPWPSVERSQTWASEMMSNQLAKNISCETEVIKESLLKAQYMGLHQRYFSILGQCDEAKISTLTEIFRTLPKGDLVEVGSYWGRSAYALGWLADFYNIGSLICVDPWKNESMESQGEEANLLDEKPEENIEIVDFEKVFLGFLSTISQLPNVGFIRNLSERAIDIYRSATNQNLLQMDELNALPLEGRIALLHIDGNHRYEFVLKDIQCWEPYLVEGGWLLLDDYLWPFGDGPKRVGDDLLSSGAFDTAFVAGDTLYLRKIKSVIRG